MFMPQRLLNVFIGGVLGEISESIEKESESYKEMNASVVDIC